MIKIIRSQQGMALLLAITIIAILTVVVVEVTYYSKVEFAVANNHLDDLKSYYIAKAGVEAAKTVIINWKDIKDFLEGMGVITGTPESATLLSDMFGTLKEYGTDEMDSGMMLGAVGKEQTGQRNLLLDYLPTNSLPVGDGSITLEMYDERGKINLYLPPMNDFKDEGRYKEAKARICARLIRLIEYVYESKLSMEDNYDEGHTPEMNIEDIVGYILDFIDADDNQMYPDSCSSYIGEGSGHLEGGLEDNVYFGFQPSYGIRNRNLDTVWQLNLVYGVDAELFGLIHNLITIYPRFDKVADYDKVNVNTAPKAVLMALDGDPDEELMDELMMERRGEEGSFTDEANLKNRIGIGNINYLSRNDNSKIGGYLTYEDSNFYTVVSTGQRAEGTKTITAVLHKDGNEVRALYWRED